MVSVNFILCIVYLILAVLNMIGILKIEYSQVFGMTVGALFLCIAPLVKNEKFRNCMYILSAGFIIGFPLIENANKYIQDVDSNTFMLLSLSVTFLANYTSKVEIKRKEIEQKKILEDLKTIKNKIKDRQQ